VKHLVPVLWLALLVGLGVRGIVRDDARYARGMFNYALSYEIDTRFILDDGTVLDHAPRRRDVKRGHAFAEKVKLDGWYGIGAVRSELNAYGKRIVKRAPRHARALEIELKWTKHDNDGPHVEVMRFEVKR
jgi:hypothetical protein